MRILLINPPHPRLPGELKHASPPLGLAYMAAVLEQHDHCVRILDCVIEGYHTESRIPGGPQFYGLTLPQIAAAGVAFRPDLVGISCMFATVDAIVRALVESLKRALPDVPVVVGGAHATATAEALIREPFIDYLIRGEGDYALLHLVEHLAGRRSRAEVPNLTWLEDGAVRANPQEFISDLDGLPLPARHLLDLAAYSRLGAIHGPTGRQRATTLITSRGCPARCVFCSIHGVWGHAFRSHSPEYVLREIRQLREAYSIEHLLFEDDNLTLDAGRARAIFAGMISEGMRVTWSARNGVALWALDEELLRLMRDSGCSWLAVAVESGDPNTLRNIIHKPLRLEKVDPLVRACRRLGIHTHAYFVVGLPGETLAAIDRTLKLAETLPVDSISVFNAAPYPGTPLYDMCLEQGYLVEDFDFGRLTSHTGQIRTPEFTPEQVAARVSRTLFRRALRHPVGEMRRLMLRGFTSPRATASFVARQARRLVGHPSRV